ncbi:MAG: amidohydrolase family protein, partial [Gammaproteobacteria bacterium]|nr:amidohydrolase family protein [Gammaproteobacteria bacterium]
VFSGGRPEDELQTIEPIFNTQDTPMRTYLSARAEMVFARFNDDEKKAIQFLNQLPQFNVERIKFIDKRAKVYVDGSYVDQVGVYNEPGYVDGHHGQMMTPKKKLLEYMRALWAEDYAINIHTMGDKGAKIAVDILQQLQNERPRFNHGYVIEHVNAASPEDLRRAANLGASVSALIWPLFSVGEQFADKVLGTDRIYTGFPLKTILDNNMTLAIHADTVVSPPQPLLLAWMAINRTTASGRVMGESERLSVDDAMRAITIGPARILGMADDIGSIRAGKKADFVVLEKDPYKVNPKKLKDIQIWGTVFDGKVYPVKQQ